MSSEKCSVVVCDRDVGDYGARGYCRSHYEWSRNHGGQAPVHAIGRIADRKPCSVAACDRWAEVKSYCPSHYAWASAHGWEVPTHAIAALVETGQRCSVDACDRPARTKGFCHAHYIWSWNNGGKVPVYAIGRTPQKTPTTCSVPACGRAARTKGHCDAHAVWSRNHGSEAPVHAVGNFPTKARKVCSVDSCERLVNSQGYCAPHVQWSRNHGWEVPVHAINLKGRPLGTRLADRIVVDEDTGCWLWTGSLNDKGYGQITVTSNGVVKTRSVHRLSWQLIVGPIPEGLEIDHLCSGLRRPGVLRNGRPITARSCCNVAHLEPVTHQENIRRATERQRQIKAGTYSAPVLHDYFTNVRGLPADTLNGQEIGEYA